MQARLACRGRLRPRQSKAGSSRSANFDVDRAWPFRRRCRVAAAKAAEQRLVLVERLLGHAASGTSGGRYGSGCAGASASRGSVRCRRIRGSVVEDRVLPGETNSAAARRPPRRRDMTPAASCSTASRSRPCAAARLGRGGRLQQQTQLIEFVEAAAGDLRRGAIADQMGLDDQPLAFQPAERFADRRLRDVEFRDQIVDGDARARRESSTTSAARRSPRRRSPARLLARWMRPPRLRPATVERVRLKSAAASFAS